MPLLVPFFTVSIESTGALSSFDLLIEACEVLEAKCRYLKDEIKRAPKQAKKKKKKDEGAEEEVVMEE